MDEWISRSDIGKKIDSITNTILTEERYLQVEENYINEAKAFIGEVGAKKIAVRELYKISDEDDFAKWNDSDLFDFYGSLVEGEYECSAIDIIMRLALREYVQVTIQLITPALDCAIHFGYDYYMYFVSDAVDFASLKNKLSQYRIFVS
ncbi:MAG: hypothetical protein EOP56_14205 [Sphingobacteriales bacterium]|nr:MAG: hypothetical protein EOP56_14205 [Sphingobacteriales bacterium]